MSINLNQDFVSKYIDNPTWNKNNYDWQVFGFMNQSNLSNQLLHIDIRRHKDFKNIKINTKADKILFEDQGKWILVDTEELMNYVKQNNLKNVTLQDLLSKLEWNIILPKI
tara:strand:+ start:425 stop:757 length:333 start_codon:yes stop_codon:yes gene_type:complete